MKISGYDPLNAANYTVRISSQKTGSETKSAYSNFIPYDKLEISSPAMQKLQESSKEKLVGEYEDMRIYAADYKDALDMIESTVREKENAPDLASCGEYYLMTYHKASVDKDLSDTKRSRIQADLEEGYVNFIHLRAEKEGWDESASSVQATRETIRAIGSKDYYNEYFTPVFNAVLDGDFATAMKLRSGWDAIAQKLRNGQANDEETARRMKELSDAAEEKRRINAQIEIVKHL